MVRGADRHITLPPGWVEKFVEAPEGCDYKAQAFGHEKEIHYYISRFSEEMYWVRMHERGHAWDWELRRDMPTAPINVCSQNVGYTPMLRSMLPLLVVGDVGSVMIVPNALACTDTLNRKAYRL